MSEDQDHSIGAKVKALLVRKGVDLRAARFGVTGGVVSIAGSLSTAQSSGDDLQAVMEEISLARWLNRQIKRVSGVRDVVFNLQRIRRDGPRFKPR